MSTIDSVRESGIPKIIEQNAMGQRLEEEVSDKSTQTGEVRLCDQSAAMSAYITVGAS